MPVRPQAKVFMQPIINDPFTLNSLAVSSIFQGMIPFTSKFATLVLTFDQLCCACMMGEHGICIVNNRISKV